MYSEQHPRTRPRVSRACQRCRIKKAKCDGAKPCRRCNLDKAPCTYKVRRKTESANATQRYTDLLLQHHAALTAGLIELYSRSLKGHKWAGPPVEEINGSPSVHRILEELGVIEGEDEAEAETKAASNLPPPPAGREPVAPLRMKTTNLTSGPKIKKLPPILQPQVPERYDNNTASSSPPLRPQSRSPFSTASTCTKIASASSYSPREESRAVRRPPSLIQCGASPPDSGGPLSRRSSGGSTSTPGPWDSPEFAEELFTTPVPSPTASSPQQDYQYEQQQQQRPETAIYGKQLAAGSAGPRTAQAAFDFNPVDMYMREPMVPNSLGCMSTPFPTTTSTDTEACSAGYFYDATTGGMGTGTGTGMYGWDYSTGNNSNVLGYQDFGGMEYSSWDSGVFV